MLGTPAPSFCNTKSAANPSTEGKSRDRNQDHSPGSWSCSTKPAPPLTTSPHPPSCIETDCLAHHMLGWADVRSTRASLEWTTSLHPLCRNSIQSSYSRSTTPALSATSSLLCHSQTGLLLPHPAWLMSLMSLMLCSPAGGCHSTTAVCSGTSPLWSITKLTAPNGLLIRPFQCPIAGTSDAIISILVIAQNAGA